MAFSLFPKMLLQIKKRLGASIAAGLAVLAVAMTLIPAHVITSQEPAPAQTTAGVVAPNLMVIMANGFSMHREMDDRSYPSRPGTTSRPFVSLADTSVDLATSHTLPTHGDYATSKLAIAKRALSDILDDDKVSGNINFGFATWRTLFGQPLWARTSTWQYYGASPYPNDFDIINQPTSNRYAYAADPLNFKAIDYDLGPIATNSACPARGTNSNTNVRGPSGYGIFGRGLCDSGYEVTKESIVDYMTASGGVGGLPRHLAPNHLGGYWDIWSNPQGVGQSQNNYPAPNNYGWVGWFISHDPTKPPNAAHFCGTWYNSEANYFGATYLLDYALPGGQYHYAHDFMHWNWPASNQIGGGGTLSCSGATVPNENRDELIGKQVRNPDGSLDTAYTSFIPRFYNWNGNVGESVPNGTLSGWSGENVLINGGTASETLTATYPSGPAATENPSAPGRQLLSRGFMPNGVTHMGVFLDLPSPLAGYIDQRETVRGFMHQTQMSATGLEYDPTLQRIASIAGGPSTKGVRASDEGGDGQSPVYDSLFGALAYYSAYKQADPNDNCRSNHVLLLYDGKENSRYYSDASVPGGIRFADPAEMSKRLFTEFNVQTHVVIISSIRGDIEEANRIAKEGGTTNAYVVGNTAQLQSALKAVFNDVQAKLFTAPPSVPIFVRGGDIAYSAANQVLPFYGTVRAHTILPTGAIDPTPLWDTNSRMTVASRKSNLMASYAGSVTQFDVLPDAAFAIPTTSSLTGTIIKGYTIDPSYGGGVYLSGRLDGALQGKTSSARPLAVESIASPELATVSGYLDYTKALAASSKIVLYSSDDGFLYAVGQEGTATAGLLRWGWMPEHLLRRLYQYSTFHGTRAMDGHFKVVDVPRAGGFDRIVLGVADKGRFHFALRLDDTGGLAQVLWQDHHPAAASDALMSPQVVRTASNTTAVYLRGTALRTIDLVSGATTDRDLSALSVSGKLTALHVRQDMTYVGTAEGQTYEIAASSTLVGDLRTIAGGTASEILVNSITTAAIDGTLYVVSSSGRRMTVFSKPYESSAGTAYTRLWSVYNGGAEGSGVSGLVAAARISAAPLVVEGVIFLPVTIDGEARVDSCLKGAAEMHFFDLGNGIFPTGRVIVKDTDVPVTGKVVLGLGDALGAISTQFEGGVIGAYVTAQSSDPSSGGAGSAPIAVRSPGTRLVWWKEKDRDSY